MSKTILGLFQTYAKAQQVKQTLVAEGYPAQSMKVVAKDEEDAVETTNNATSGSTSVGAGGAAGIGEKIGNYFRNLTGGDEEAHHHYAQGGGALLAVTAADDQAYTFAALLKEHGAVDIEQ
jgi:hypothetical protein